MVYSRAIPRGIGRRSARLGTALVVGSALTFAACGNSSAASRQSPRQGVAQAVSALGKQSSLSVTFSVGLTKQQVEQLSSKGGGTPATPAEAQAVSEGSIYLAAQTGHGEALDSAQAATDTTNSYEIGLRIGSDTPFEVVYTSQNLYARVDAAQLLSDVGQDPAKASAFDSALSQAAVYVPGLDALAKGQWVELSHASLHTLGELLKQQGAASGSSTPTSSEVSAAIQKLRSAFGSSLMAATTFADVGSTGGRTEYKATLDVHSFLSSFGPTLESDLAAIPVTGSKLSSSVKQGLSRAESKIPANQTAVADLYVSGGKLQEADVDLNQFAGKDKASFPVPVKAVFAAPPTISAPSGATMLDLSNLPKLFQGLMAGVHSTTT